LYRSFQRRCAKAGVPRIPVHGARHTCASLLVELDVHPRVAMQILRHAKIATTMDIYTHVPTTATRAALGWVSQCLDSANSAPPASVIEAAGKLGLSR
jgi:integrase